MALDTITREEFDRRLEQSTDRMRRERLALEARAAELEDLIGKYAAVLERTKVETAAPIDTMAERREVLPGVLTEKSANER